MNEDTKSQRWAERLVSRMFQGRKGHGGTEGVTFIKVNRATLREIAKQSFEAGQDSLAERPHP
jgi:tryptophan 2,3-dioxygenase